jgi:hypothetical protein
MPPAEWSTALSSSVHDAVLPLRSKSMAASPNEPSANPRATSIMPSSTPSSPAALAIWSTTCSGSGRSTSAQRSMICTPRVRNARFRAASVSARGEPHVVEIRKRDRHRQGSHDGERRAILGSRPIAAGLE